MPQAPPTPNYTVSPSLQPDKSSKEVGRVAVWSVSSAKPGNGVELLRDGRDETYWQSDGMQPHMVNIQFQKKVLTSFMCHVTVMHTLCLC